MADLNRVYSAEPGLSARDFSEDGFVWLEADDQDHNVLSFLRQGETPEETVLVVCNFAKVPWDGYLLGVPCAGYWQELLNSDASVYGGSGGGNLGGCQSESVPAQGQPHAIRAFVPPLAVLYFRRVK